MDDWRRYPLVPDWGDPAWFTFPAVDGGRNDLGMSTYFVCGFVRGRTSGRQYAFMTIVTDMRVLAKRVRVSFHTLALYDCDGRRYGTSTDYDFPRALRWRRAYKLETTRDHLALRWHGDAGTSRWENRRAADGSLLPFAWDLDLHGIDHHGARMRLELEMDAVRPPGPLGGRLLGGEMMFLGIPRTYSYFQSGLQMRGRLTWGDVAEEVSGDVGWIDRQWAPDDFSRHQDRQSARYRNEWRLILLDSGWDMSCFHQYLRPQRNAVVPWSGLTAQGPGPDFALRATADVVLDVPEFIRSPGVVRARSMLTEGPRWFPHRYRLRAPAWDLDLAATPLVDAPAHALPIEYWTGPVRVAGTSLGRAVTGWGFDERSRPWCRDFELAKALALTVAHLDDVEPAEREALAYRASEVEAILLRGDSRAAAAHLAARVDPLIGELSPGARARVEPLLGDLRTVVGAAARRRPGR